MTKNTIHTDRAPRHVRSGLRTDTRAILRSRPLQAALVVVAGVQVMAVASGESSYARQPKSLEAAVASNLAPVVVAAPVKAALTLDKAGRSQPSSVEKLALAEELAETYRKKGFKVSPRLARQIHDAAVKNDIDPKIAFGLVKTESGFKNSATSHVGAIGLTQLMPATARWLKRGVTVSELRQPETNLNIGFRYLRDLIDKYDGNTTLALLAYNRGPGTVDRVLKRGGNPDNGYADMVFGRRNSHR